MDTTLQNVSEKAQDLYQQMLSSSREEGGTDVYSQKEMADVMQADIKDLKDITQELVNAQLIQLVMLQSTNEVGFKVMSVDDASKKNRMGGDELLVYNCIEAADREGIWTKSIKDRTKLHQTVIQRCLKNLESQKYIKAIKSVKHPTRKIYMLFNLQPSVEVTGGPWFTDSEMDSEFINSLLMVVWKYVTNESFPSSVFESDDLKQQTFPSSFSGYPTVKKIHKFVMNSGVVNEGTDLGEADIRKLCEVLVYDDKLERRDGGFSYKATWQSVVEAGFQEHLRQDALSESACGQCPRFELCKDDGPVNPVECPYYDEWLNGQEAS